MSRALGVVIAGSLIIGCKGATQIPPGGKATGAQEIAGASCAQAIDLRGAPTSWPTQPPLLRSDLPPSLRQWATRVITSDTVDLDCDGRADVVAQVVGSADSPTPEKLAMVVVLADSSSGRIVFWGASSVRGPERIQFVAPLHPDSLPALVLVGIDEGGLVPRVLVWRAGEYRVVLVPKQNYVHDVSDWSQECVQSAMPVFMPPNGLSLVRDSTGGEMVARGAGCELPRDTIALDSANQWGRFNTKP